MKKSDDPDDRVAGYWRKRYGDIDADYQRRDVIGENARIRRTHSWPATSNAARSGRDDDGPSRAPRVDPAALDELKAKILADICRCKYLLASLRDRWHQRLSEIVVTEADATTELDGLSDEVETYRHEYPFHFTGLGQAGKAELLRSDLVGLTALLTALAGNCLIYRHRMEDAFETLEEAVARRRLAQATWHNSAGPSADATSTPSSGPISVCVHCGRSAHLVEENGRAWCSWCGTWASL